MSIKCGSCKGRHQTVEAVRACFQGRAWDAAMNGDAAEVAEIQRREREEDERVAHAKAMRDAHVFQGGFSGTGTCPGCGATRGHTHDDDCRTYAAQASRRTPRNLDEQRTRQRRDPSYVGEPMTRGKQAERSWGQEMPAVPAGSYALRDAEGVVKFYQVDRPEKGKWAGWVFLSAQASDEKWPIKKVDTKREILTRIAEDLRGAMALYGQELGECSKCHRTLTDEESRRIGVGPDCRKKHDL